MRLYDVSYNSTLDKQGIYMNNLFNMISSLNQLCDNGWDVQTVGELNQVPNEPSLTIYIANHHNAMLLGRFYLSSLSELLMKIAQIEEAQTKKNDGLSHRERATILLSVMLEHYTEEKPFNGLTQKELVESILLASVSYLVNTRTGGEMINVLSSEKNNSNASFFVIADIIQGKTSLRPFGFIHKHNEVIDKKEVMMLVEDVLRKEFA
jgi:hypothetical protein